MRHIDASHLEGGGQLPRIALCLSSITLTPIHLTNIRANRASHSYSRKPAKLLKPGKHGGLKESHLAALNFLAEACDAKVTGEEIGSRDVIFKPGQKRCLTQNKTRIELKNPGSVFLIFQALYPYLVFAQHPPTRDERDEAVSTFELTLIGGTNVDKSMSLEYVQQVFLPICREIGLPDAQVECVKRGWAGSAQEVGEVRITVDLPEPKEGARSFVLEGFRIEEKEKVEKVVVNVLAHTKEVREMVKETTRNVLRSTLSEQVEVEVEVDEDSGHETRLYILLVAHISNGWRLGRDFLGSGRKARNEKERDMMLEKAVSKVVGDLVREINGGGCVDEYLQDQLVVFQSLATGRSLVKGRDGEGTLHTQTVRWVCEQMLGDYGVKFDKDGGCTGVSWNVDGELGGGLVKGLEELEVVDED